MLEGGVLELFCWNTEDFSEGWGGLSRPTDGCPPLCFPLAHMQGGPASEVKVLLSENQSLTAKEGAP